MYLISRGTPVDIQWGDTVVQHTTDRDLHFPVLLAEGEE